MTSAKETTISFLVDYGIVSRQTLWSMFRKMLRRKFDTYPHKKRDSVFAFIGVISILSYMAFKRYRGLPPSDKNEIDEKNKILGTYDSRTVSDKGTISMNLSSSPPPSSFSVRR